MAQVKMRPDPTTGAPGSGPAAQVLPNCAAAPAEEPVVLSKPGRDRLGWLILVVPVIALCFPLLLRRACGE
jgi:hypothetical protein